VSIGGAVFGIGGGAVGSSVGGRVGGGFCGAVAGAGAAGGVGGAADRVGPGGRAAPVGVLVGVETLACDEALPDPTDGPEDVPPGAAESAAADAAVDATAAADVLAGRSTPAAVAVVAATGLWPTRETTNVVAAITPTMPRTDPSTGATVRHERDSLLATNAGLVARTARRRNGLSTNLKDSSASATVTASRAASATVPCNGQSRPGLV
jgi:hypothetical protein